MILRRKNGQVNQQVGYIIAAVVLVMALLAHYVKRGVLSTAYGVDPAMQKKVIRWRKKSEIIVIGKILNIREKINESVKPGLYDPAMSYLVFDVEVEKVLRGSDPGQKIQVYFGWFSAEGDGEEFPAGLKQDYATGERVKLFLDYDEMQYGYYCPGAYYTMDPLD